MSRGRFRWCWKGRLIELAKRGDYSYNNAYVRDSRNDQERPDRTGDHQGFVQRGRAIVEGVFREAVASGRYEPRILELLAKGDERLERIARGEAVEPRRVESTASVAPGMEAQLPSVSHTFESKSGNRYVKRGGKWFRVGEKGSEAPEQNPHKIRAAEKGKVQTPSVEMPDGKTVFSRSEGEPKRMANQGRQEGSRDGKAPWA